MEYFCYVSRDKVDQLFHNYFPGESDEWQENRTIEHDVGASVDAGFSIASILNLFKGGITYGRKGAIQRERKVKMEYVEKLRKVLLAIAKDNPIPSLTDAIKSDNFRSLCYHHEGPFRLKTPVDSGTKSDQIVTIRTKALSRKLLLDCSLRFFSEGIEPDGTFHYKSATSRFFSGDLTLQFMTIFIFLGLKGNNIVGTPLFLKLEVPDTLDGFMTI